MSDQIEIKLFANLRKLYKKQATITLSQPRPISDVLDEIHIPKEKISIIFLNGKHAGFDAVVSPGDRLALFPPIGGG